MRAHRLHGVLCTGRQHGRQQPFVVVHIAPKITCKITAFRMSRSPFVASDAFMRAWARASPRHSAIRPGPVRTRLMSLQEPHIETSSGSEPVSGNMRDEWEDSHGLCALLCVAVGPHMRIRNKEQPASRRQKEGITRFAEAGIRDISLRGFKEQGKARFEATRLQGIRKSPLREGRNKEKPVPRYLHVGDHCSSVSNDASPGNMEIKRWTCTFSIGIVDRRAVR